MAREQDVFSQRQQGIDTIPFGENWRDARRENQIGRLGALEAVEREHQDYFNNLDKKAPTNLEDVVLRDYTKAIKDNTKNTVVDWDKVDRVVASWSPQAQAELEKSRLAAGTDKEREYLRDVAALEPYFEARDAQWAKFKGTNANFAAYDSYEDYKQSRYDLVASKNPSLPSGIVQATVNQALAPIEEALSMSAQPILARDRQLVALLSKHGFYVPAQFRAFTVPAGELVTPGGR
jgi:hypothetical protein